MSLQKDSTSMEDRLEQATQSLRETPAAEIPMDAVARAEAIATVHPTARSWRPYIGPLAACAAMIAIAASVALFTRHTMEKNARRTVDNDGRQIMDKERDQFNVRFAKSEKEKQDLNKKIIGLTRDQARLIQKFASMRLAPQTIMVRRSEGHILSVASEDVAYIDLGQGDQIVPGMTFEVYNKHDGIPAMGDGLSDDSNTPPAGEASLEVEEVLATSSRCRVTKLEPGQHITEGDLIANLAYDRNTKFNFVVCGKFKLNPTSPVPTVADADIIKGLIVKWGGKVQDHVDVDTDFLVMGAEPKVKDYTADELADPFVKALHDRDVAEQQAYADVLDKAKDYSITIMNQNRFLYYTGYYPLAER